MANETVLQNTSPSSTEDLSKYRLSILSSEEEEDLSKYRLEVAPPEEESEPYALEEDIVSPVVDYDPAIPAAKMIAALKFLDRGRSANAGFLISLGKGEGFDAALDNWKEGIKGEAHPLFGDLLYELAEENRKSQREGAILGPNTLTGLFQRMLDLIPWLSVTLPSYEPVGGDPEGTNAFEYSDTELPSGEEFEKVKTELKIKLDTLFDKPTSDALFATIGGIVADVAVDPISYTGIGLTKRGKLAKIKEAVEAGEVTVKSGSKLSEDLAAFERTGKLEPYGETTTERLQRGQERVLIGGIPIPAKMAGEVSKRLAQSKLWLGNTTVGSSIRQMFSTEYGLEGNLKEFKNLEESFTDIIAFNRETIIKDNAALKKKIELLAEDLSRITGENITPNVLNKFITEQTELFDKALAKKSTLLGTTDVSASNELMKRWTSRLPEKLRPNLRPTHLTPSAQELITKEPRVLQLVKDLRAKNDSQMALERTEGILKTPLTEGPSIRKKYLTGLLSKAGTKDIVYDPVRRKYMKVSVLEKELERVKNLEVDADRVEYFMHAATPEFKEAIRARRAKEAKASKEPFMYSKGHASTLQRNFRNYTVEEINQLAAAGKLPGYEGVKISKAFHDDPAVAQVLRDMRHSRSLEVLKFLEESKDQFGRAVRKGEELSLPDGWAMARNPVLQGYAFPTEIAKRLDGHYEALMNPKRMSIFIDKIVDPVTNWYKAWTLGIFPEYHLRNAISNVFNNFVTGTHNPLVYKIARDIQMGKAGFISTPGGGKVSYDAIRNQVGVLGIKNKGFMSADIEQTLINEMGYGKWITLSRDNKAIHYGQKVGEAVDNNARIGKYVDELMKGSSSKRAVDSVRHSLFDYTDLTWAEREVGKRLMPFYTWSRKNIPFQMEMMMRKPGKYKAMDTARQEIERDTHDEYSVSEAAVSNWIMESYGVRVKVDKEDGLPRYFLLGSWLSAGDIWRLGSVPDRILTDLISPPLKVLFEYGFNYDTFKRKTIAQEDAEGKEIPEKIDFLDMRVDKKTAHVLKTIRLLKTIDDMIPKDKKMDDIRVERDRTTEEILLDLVTGLRTYAQDVEMNRVYRSKKKAKALEDQKRALGKAYVPYETEEGEIRETPASEIKALEEMLEKDIHHFERIWEEDKKKTLDKYRLER